MIQTDSLQTNSKKGGTMARSEIEKFFSSDDDFFTSRRNTTLITGEDDLDIIPEDEGQLSIDMYDSPNEYVVKAPIAGVRAEDLEVSVTEDMITIRGKRAHEIEHTEGGFHIQECYWGSFARSQSFPAPVIAERAEASLKDGVLTVSVPKANRSKGKLLKIKTA